MTTISKGAMCHLLYCLNWHIKDLCQKAAGSSPQDKEALLEEISPLWELKEKVLAKLIMEGHADIRGVQKNIRTKRKYYSIRMTRGFSFHLPMKEFKEYLNEFEKAGNDTPSEGAQAGDI